MLLSIPRVSGSRRAAEAGSRDQAGAFMLPPFSVPPWSRFGCDACGFPAHEPKRGVGARAARSTWAYRTGEGSIRRPAMVALATSMTMAVGSGAFAAASPPDRFEAPIVNAHPDFENNLAVFVDTSRKAYCTPEVEIFEAALIDRIEGGFVGASPEEPAFPDGIELISGKTKATDQGAAMASIKARGLHIGLWELDAPEDLGLAGPCLDTDDANTMSASGASTLQGHDNDFDFSGTRGNSFGERGRASVMDDNGADWAYSWKLNLNSKCYTPDDGPPSCLLETATLAAR